MRLLVLSLVAAATVLASGKTGTSGGGGGGGTTATATTTPEMRTASETAPAGGTVQIKTMFTQPHPISSTGGKFSMYDMSVDGVAVWSPLGDAAGTALVQNGTLALNLISPTAGLGTGLDYPFLTVTMDIPKTAVAGTVLPLNTNFTFTDANGPFAVLNTNPGTLTIGGSLSINGVWPGGGTYPPGTIINVRGTGFQPGLKLVTRMKTSSPVYVSDRQIQFVLQETATLDQQSIRVDNPDRSTVTYYSYLRGVLIQQPSREILRRVEPVFPAVTRGTMTVTPQPLTASGQFTAVAIQNPNQASVSVMLYHARTNTTVNYLLPSGGRLMDEVSHLLGGVALASGDTVVVSANAGVQMLGINADETADAVAPFLPAY